MPSSSVLGRGPHRRVNLALASAAEWQVCLESARVCQSQTAPATSPASCLSSWANQPLRNCLLVALKLVWIPSTRYHDRLALGAAVCQPAA